MEDSAIKSKKLRIYSLTDTISDFESKLLRYKKFLEENPNSTFYTGLVKITTEFIEELNNELKKLESEL